MPSASIRCVICKKSEGATQGVYIKVTGHLTRNFLILLSFLCYRDHFDDYKIFVILLNQSLVIHEISNNRTKPDTFFEAEVFSYELLKFQKNSLKPAGEQLKRVKVPQFQSFVNISYILLIFVSLITLLNSTCTNGHLVKI